jgi:pantetheine-phosphate adenylyltransferase
MKKAVFPGSFDPITLGHEDVITRAIPLFDEIIIAIGINSNKKYMFSLEQRIKFIEECFQEYDNVKVVAYEGLTVDFCKTHAIEYIIRGLRNPADFEFEKAIAHTNRDLAPIETIFLLTAAKTSYMSSSIVREVLINGGDVSSLVPGSVPSKIES